MCENRGGGGVRARSEDVPSGARSGAESCGGGVDSLFMRDDSAAVGGDGSPDVPVFMWGRNSDPAAYRAGLVRGAVAHKGAGGLADGVIAARQGWP